MVVGGINKILHMDAVAESVGYPVSKHQIDDLACVWRMGGLIRDGTAEPVSRETTFSGANRDRQRKIIFPCSAEHEQDSQRPYPVDPPDSAWVLWSISGLTRGGTARKTAFSGAMDREIPIFPVLQLTAQRARFTTKRLMPPGR